MANEASRDAVRETFDRIADHFARTRTTPWEEVTSFLDHRDSVDVGLDLGCANGRHLPVLARRCNRTIGIDISRQLLVGARRNHRTVSTILQGDATAIPMISDAVDLVLYIATIHHLPSEDERRQSLNELQRIMRSDGTVLLSTWSVTHDRFEDIEPGDHFIPWTLPNGEQFDRYYHLYDLENFEATIRSSRLQVDRVWESGGNCWAIARSP